VELLYLIVLIFYCAQVFSTFLPLVRTHILNIYILFWVNLSYEAAYMSHPWPTEADIHVLSQVLRQLKGCAWDMKKFPVKLVF
jgi:hypothetical protein